MNGQNVPPDYPITDICIVAEKSTCPNGYQVIDLTTDGLDADLWKDKFMRKTKRYFCITRNLPGPDGSNSMVIKDMSIIKETDPIPVGYSALSVTKDTYEPCLKKRQVIVQFVVRNTTEIAISEVFLTKNSKQKIAESYVKGEINGLTLSIRYGTGPKVQNTALTSAVLPQPVPKPRPTAAPRTNISLVPTRNAPIRSGTMRAINLHNQPLDGVPFQINSTFKAMVGFGNFDVPNIRHLTAGQIEEKYKYDFQTERIAEQRIIQM